MKVGFSGTRDGMTLYQQSEFEDWIHFNREGIQEFHHGACVGADAQAHRVVFEKAEEYALDLDIHGHPGFIVGHPNRSNIPISEMRFYIIPPMDRNRAIVDAVDIMMFAPKFPESKRSGTWATLRYARRMHKSIVVLAPFEKPEDCQNPKKGHRL